MTVTARLADGTELNFPDGTDPTVIQGTVKRVIAQRSAAASAVNNDQISQDAQAGPSFLGEVRNQVGNLIAGGLRGAGSIGATLISASDKLNRATTPDAQQKFLGYSPADSNPASGDQLRQDMDWSLQDMGADTSSPAFKAGKVGAEIAGTSGAGGALAKGLSAVPAIAATAPNLLQAIRTAGATAGNTGGLVNALTRATGGAISGGVSAGLVEPHDAVVGAATGGLLPTAAATAGTVGQAIGSTFSDAAHNAGRRLMQSALKPTIAQLRSGDAQTAVDTLLDYGINPNTAGVNQLRALIDDKNTAISNAIANSGATIPKSNVLAALADVRQKFGNQVSPTSDLNAIQGVEDDFLNHPNYPGADLPVQAAQDIKQGTYSVLRGKYGQLGSAETEAQKGVARGLKDEIAGAVPEVGPLNAEESRLLTTLSVTERRALMEANKNPMGLAALAHNPVGWAVFMADKSAAFKALAARLVNASAGAPNALQSLSNPTVNQLAYQAAPALVADR